MFTYLVYKYIEMINRLIIISSRAQKDLKKVPLQDIRKLSVWVNDVENLGLEEVRKLPGFHDEPPKGKT